MDENTLIIIGLGIGALILGLLLLGIAAAIFFGAIATAVDLFGWAAESGFIGIALYIIVWVVATPLMVVVCLVGGVVRAIVWWQEWREERRGPTRPKSTLPKP